MKDSTVVLVFTPSLNQLRDSVDAVLADWLNAKRAELPEAAPLLDEIDRMLMAGGKRLRPAFCYWAYRAAGGVAGDGILLASASLELLHTFALVHDDIMDAADERRGEPSVHAKLGVSVAILVGDLALVLADALLMASGFSMSRLSAAFRAYSRMREQVIAGQYLDIAATDRPELTEEEALRIARLKSGLYSIEEPMKIGALLAGASKSLLDSLARFGAPLGEAFQLHDDLLGTFGDPHSTGKPVDSDILQGKRTVLYARTLASLPAHERDFVVGNWGKGDVLARGRVDRLRSLIESSGARKEIEDLVDTRRKQALDELGRVGIDHEARHALAELAAIATGAANPHGAAAGE